MINHRDKSAIKDRLTLVSFRAKRSFIVNSARIRETKHVTEPMLEETETLGVIKNHYESSSRDFLAVERLTNLNIF